MARLNKRAWGKMLGDAKASTGDGHLVTEVADVPGQMGLFAPPAKPQKKIPEWLKTLPIGTAVVVTYGDGRSTIETTASLPRPWDDGDWQIDLAGFAAPVRLARISLPVKGGNHVV